MDPILDNTSSIGNVNIELSNEEYNQLNLDNFLQNMGENLTDKERKKLIKTYKKKQRPKISTTKVLIAFIMGNCVVVEIYSMYVMYVLQDLSALNGLIAAIIGEAMAFAVYAAKSYHETREQEKNLLERERLGIVKCNIEELPVGDIPEDEVMEEVRE